jgi:GDP-mannose 6-dehydrogenase
MEITIVGLGYVGTVSAACFAAAGHTVWGVDINPEKVRIVNEGRTPIVENNLGEKIAQARASGRLRATSDLREALIHSEVSFVAVATPSRSNGDIDATHLLRACKQIAQVLMECDHSQIVIMRSSILPSVFEQCNEIFNATAPGRVKFCVNPEFLREGTAIEDFEHPPFTLLGVEDEQIEGTLRLLYKFIAAPVFVLSPQESLLVKYASNAYHALKITFANEIGALCQHAGIDGQKVMSVFCKDTKLNISTRYLMPGFAFGGSCLPKDVRALSYAAKQYDLEIPLINSLLPSNEKVVQRAVQRVCSSKFRRIGLIGLGFKANTDDLRESPFVELAERLLGKGYDLKIFDPNVSLAQLTGSNKEYIDKVIPHLSRLLVGSIDELVECELLVIGHRYPNVREFLRSVKIPLLELG